MELDKLKENLKKYWSGLRGELKRTTSIGKRMIRASEINNSMRSGFEQLGQLVYKDIIKNGFKWDNPKAKKIIEKLELHHKNLERIDGQVVKLKHVQKK